MRHFADDISSGIFSHDYHTTLNQTLLNLAPMGLIDRFGNGLAQNKPLREPMMTQFTDAIWCY